MIDPLEAGNPTCFPNGKAKYEVKLLDVGLFVDANRDGTIAPRSNDTSNVSPAPVDVTNSENLYQIWINDDNEGTPTAETETLESTTPDYEDQRLRRDGT